MACCHGTCKTSVRYPAYPYDFMQPVSMSALCFESAQQTGGFNAILSGAGGTAAVPVECKVNVTISAATDKTLVGKSDLCSFTPQRKPSSTVEPCTFQNVAQDGVTQLTFSVADNPAGGQEGFCVDDFKFNSEI